MLSLKVIDYPNPDSFEVLAAVASLHGHARKIVVVAVYIPPGYRVGRARACMAHISDLIMEAKRRYREPSIFVCGDFNQWGIADSLADFVDLEELQVGSTRGAHSIDKIFSNAHTTVRDKGTVAPLDAQDAPEGADSDHRVAYGRFDIQRVQNFEWLTYTYLYFNE